MLGAATIIDNERLAKKISRSKLTKGLCSQQLLSKSAYANYNLEFYLFINLLERLGFDTNNLEFIITKTDLDKINIRDNIQSLILSKNYDKALTLLNGSFDMLSAPSSIDSMLYQRTLAEIYFYKSRSKEDFAKAQSHILDAIYITLPGITTENFGEYLLSSFEYENILMYLQCLCVLGETDHAAPLLLRFYQVCLDTITSQSILSDILPKCTYILSTYCQSKIEIKDLIAYVEYAISLLQNNGILYLLLPLIDNLIQLYNKTGNNEKSSYWSPYKALLEDLYAQYSPDTIQNSIFFKAHSFSLHLDNEVIAGERRFLSMSQLELASDVYQSSVSVSRLENKKSSPRKKNYDSIIKNLNLNKSRFGAFLPTTSMERLSLFESLRINLNKNNYKQTLTALNQIKPESDEEKELLDAYKSIVTWNENKSCTLSSIKHLKSFINKTYPLNATKYPRKPFKIEADFLMAYITFVHEITPENAEDLLEKLKIAYESSSCNLKYDFRSYCGFLKSYIKYCLPNQSDKSASEFINAAIRYCITCSKGSGLIGLYWSIVLRDYALNKAGDIKIAYKSYMLAELYKNSSAPKRKAYYEKLLNYKKNV